MGNTSRRPWARGPLAIAAACGAALLGASAARAQQQANGFAVERLEPSAPGSGWLVMDDLDLQGGLGGGISLSAGYAHGPLRVSSPPTIENVLPAGAQSLAVVQHQIFSRIELAVTWDRYRFHASFSSPLYVAGQGGVVGGWQFTAPSANVEHNPDTISDTQVGVEARLFGEPGGPLRLGTSVQLIVPSGDRADYSTDGTYRATGRLLVAGDLGRFAYAGYAGAHIRPLDESAPQSPRGSELLYGVAGGARLPVFGGSVLVGPEIFGATPFNAFFGSQTNALEGLATAAFDGAELAGGRLRIKLGAGAGLQSHFGAPQWRAVVALELVGKLRAATER